MNDTPASSAAMAPTPPPLNRTAVMAALASDRRWAMLVEMAKGEGLAASDLATVAGVSVSVAVSHARVLVSSGICTRGSGRVYKINPALQSDRTKPVIELGHCLVRLYPPQT